MTSEFGQGQSYCLGLFLAHEERIKGMREDYGNDSLPYSTWFYGASDHLYEFDTDTGLEKNKILRGRCRKFKKRVMVLRLPLDDKNKATKEDYRWAIGEARDLLRLLDKHHGIKTKKGNWE